MALLMLVFWQHKVLYGGAKAKLLLQIVLCTTASGGGSTDAGKPVVGHERGGSGAFWDEEAEGRGKELAGGGESQSQTCASDLIPHFFGLPYPFSFH